MINSVHRFLLFIPNPNFLLYSCNSFIIIWFLRNFYLLDYRTSLGECQPIDLKISLLFLSDFF